MLCIHSYYELPKLAGGCDVLLGLDFLKRCKSVINVNEGTCTFWHRGRGVLGVLVKILNKMLTPAKKSSVISAKQLSRCMRQGCPVVVGSFSKREEQEDVKYERPEGQMGVNKPNGQGQEAEGECQPEEVCNNDVDALDPAFGPTNKADVSPDVWRIDHPVAKAMRAEFADVFSEKFEGLPSDRHLFHTIPL